MFTTNCVLFVSYLQCNNNDSNDNNINEVRDLTQCSLNSWKP